MVEIAPFGVEAWLNKWDETRDEELGCDWWLTCELEAACSLCFAELLPHAANETVANNAAKIVTIFFIDFDNSLTIIETYFHIIKTFSCDYQPQEFWSHNNQLASNSTIKSPTRDHVSNQRFTQQFD